MKISELPTPRLRARAMELALAENKERSARWDYNLDEAFVWSDTEEDREFWLACYEGNWDKAKELQPSLFKPMDGKPHIKLTSETSLSFRSGLEDSTTWGLDIANSDLFRYEDIGNVYLYTDTVNPALYTTIKEAVDALYSFKREENP